MSSRLVLLAAVLLALPLGGCTRLNPGWCDEHAQCEPHEYCDPGSNTCVPRDAGLPLPDGSSPDAPALESGADLPPPHADGPAPGQDQTIDGTNPPSPDGTPGDG